MRRLLLGSLLLTLLTLGVGCDDGSPPPPPPPRDSGPPGDAGGDMDSGMAGDAGEPQDGDVPPPSDAGVPSCMTSSGDVFELATDSRLGGRVIALAGGPDRFAVLWNETRAGRPDVFGRVFSTSGLDAEVRLTDTTSRENAPTVLATGTRWIAAWTDNEGTTGFDLRTQLLDADLSAVGGRNDVTASAMLREDVPVLGRTAAGPIVAWVEDNMVAFSREVRVRRLNEDGTPNGATQMASESGRQPGRVSPAELTGGPAVLWGERAGTGQEVWLQPLTEAGARDGSPTEVTEAANGDGTVDAALTVSGGAVVFGVQVSGVRNEVRFRAISGDGMLDGSERILTPAGDGRDGSIAQFAGGYAVSYRDTQMSPARIVLLLVSPLGDVIAEVPVADAEAGGGRTSVAVSGEGDIGIAWADDPGGDVAIRAALVRCGS